MGKSKAPHFLVLSGPALEQMHVNAGFAGEHLVISLTAWGLATCRLGGHLKTESLPQVVPGRKNCAPSAMIAFGHPTEPDGHLRTDPNHISRKPLVDLMLGSSTAGDWAPLLETSRLAPSAVNRQPWRFKTDGSFLHCYIRKPGSFISKKLLGSMGSVDAGIALCHIAEAAAQYNIDISFEQMPDTAIHDLTYITSARNRSL